MSRDLLQQKINQLSLVMTIPEDIVRACKQANMPPAFVETMIRLHNQQVELEKAVNSLRTTMLEMAKVVDMQADFAGTFQTGLMDLQKHIGYNPEETVTAEQVGQD